MDKVKSRETEPKRDGKKTGRSHDDRASRYKASDLEAHLNLPSHWPASKIETWPLAKVLPYARNPRQHSEDQVDKIGASITEWGWTMPLLVAEDGELIAGHGRVLAAEKLGINKVPVLIARGWSEQQRRSYRIADNQLTLLGTWDPQLLAMELQALEAAHYPLAMTGFGEVELVQFMARLAGPQAPGEFGAVDENLPTEHCCPKCGYRWSGNPNAGAQKEET